MKTTHKYPLVIGGLNHVMMPNHAEIVHVDAQGNVPCLWALVDPDADTEIRQFCVIGTGLPIGPRDVHIGTVLMSGGILVWHVVERVGA